MGNRKSFLVFLILLLFWGSGTAFASGLFDSSKKNTVETPEGVVSASADTAETNIVSEAAEGGTDAAVTGAEGDDTVPDQPLEQGAQVEGEPSFRLSETDSGLLFFQRLTWEEAQYAVRYTVILQRKKETIDAFEEVLRRNVELPYTDISVPPGEYRYSVLSFNILGLLDFQTDWEYFTVLQALHPAILSFTPEAFYFDRPSSRIITLLGENLLPQAEIYLESKTSFDESGAPMKLLPREIYRNELGENARLLFLEEDLIAGEYDFIVKNPGGLETRSGAFTIAVAKPFDINAAAGYSPKLAVFGQKDYFLDHVPIFPSFSARGSFIPFKLPYGNFGVELNADWSYLTSEQDIFKTSAHLVLVHAGGLFQIWILPKKLSFNARAGAGIAGFFNYRFEHHTGKTWDPINTSAFSFSLGASVQWLFYKQFFVEGGVDYTQVVHSELPLGFARFGLFGGYQF